MHKYITDTKHSATELIKIIFDEENACASMRAERDGLLNKASFYCKEHISKDLHEDFSEMQVMHDFMQMAEAKKKADDLQLIIDELQNSIDAKEFSLCALCGALLQISKQGISLVHGSLNASPDGRNIGRETLKNIIWQARNQSMHFEDGKPHPPVRACFQNLEADFGSGFSLSLVPHINLARNVVTLLEWSTYEEYESDMISLLG